MKKSVLVFAFAMLISLFGLSSVAHADSTLPDDRFALKGLKQVNAIFDVRLADLDKLIFNLELIKETWEGINNQKVKPNLIVSLRGPAVKLFTKGQATPELKELLVELRQKGIRVEICSVATRVFKVDNTQLLPELILVGNVLISQIAWQNKGYALVTLN